MSPPRFGRTGSLLYVAAVYALAAAAMFAVFSRSGAAPLVTLALGMLASTAVLFLATLHVGNGSVFDPWWSVVPPLAAIWLCGLSAQPEITARQALVVAVVWFWGVRLTFNWWRNWPGLHHEDWRYVGLIESWPLPAWAVRLIAVELAPSGMVILGCLPLYPALALGGAGLGALDWFALAVGLGAVVLETTADEQMHAFRRRRGAGEVMQEGLWRYSRHPNYLGEILFWVALWLFALAADPAWWWTGVGPLAMIVLFVFGSVPMLDRRSHERRPEFAAYARRTSALVLWFPRSRD